MTNDIGVREKISFRLAQLADLEKIESIVQAAYRGGQATVDWKNENHLVQGPRVDRLGLEKILTDSKKHLLVAESDSTILACVLAELEEDGVVAIGMIAVDPAKQNLGLGRLLVQAGENEARTSFHAHVGRMYVVSCRDELIGWYGRQNYLDTGKTAPFPEGEDTGLSLLKKGIYFRILEKNLTLSGNS